jgi:GT2 family glycosyltransferase
VTADCVITVVAGRHDHLRAQRAFLAAAVPAPARHIVVAVDDPQVAEVVAEQPGLPTTVIPVTRALGGLPVAAARNAGARAAIAAGAQTLIFLDVDCLPARGLVSSYAHAAQARPRDLLCGPVTYLPPAPAAGWTRRDLARLRHPHPARPDPPAGTLRPGRPSQFWSLSFAVTAAAWRALPSFYEGYLGYGAEDTDFARTAVGAGAGIVFVGGADAFHQHHPVSSPPVEHLDDIVRNSAVYAQRHGQLPMGGWLDGFASRGLITMVDGLPRRTDPIRVATIPAWHPYLDAVMPTTVQRVSVDRVTGWEPDPLLTPEVLAARAADIDVFHVHFGYDHIDPRQLARWLGELQRARIPLVVTVHDLRNPHHESRPRHDAQLALLIRSAARVLTLTDPAADECQQRFGRRPEVVAHPTLLAGVPREQGPPVPAPGRARAAQGAAHKRPAAARGDRGGRRRRPAGRGHGARAAGT